jgi:xylan 1,4-beta-xylosidase
VNRSRMLVSARVDISLPASQTAGEHTSRRPVASLLVLLSCIYIFGALGSVEVAKGGVNDPRLTIDSSRIVGTIKPLQDLGAGPLLWHGAIDLTPYYKELGVRNVRLHDVPLVYDDVQDIDYVFPNDAADSTKADSYNFALTDHYMDSVTSAGFNVIYRLGYSGDTWKPRTLLHDNPPRSLEKWADIASHIVDHYNAGWAGGPRTHIKYWEIWNEPDAVYSWTGTPEAYFRLYELTAKQIKSRDPTLKVGGPALAGNLDFLEAFLKYCRDHQAPVDFVSWHSYEHPARPEEVAKRGKRVHDLMLRYGFGGAQSILDEWNYDLSVLGMFSPSPAEQPTQPYTAEYIRSQHEIAAKPYNTEDLQKYYEITHGEIGAAYNAAVLMDLQDSSVDIATFYTGTNMVFGLFNWAGAPTKAYYSFLAFRRLLDSPQRVAVNGAVGSEVTALAGLSSDKRTLRVLISHTGEGKRQFELRLANLPWGEGAIAKVQTIDRSSDFAQTRLERVGAKSDLIHIEMDGPTVELLTIDSP